MNQLIKFFIFIYVAVFFNLSLLSDCINLNTLRYLKQLSFSGEKAATAYLAGYNKPFDGRGGIFKWYNTDFSSELFYDKKNAIIIPPDFDSTGKSGAWVRQCKQYINVKWFGATGNEGIDDSKSIEAASFFFQNLPKIKQNKKLYFLPQTIYFPTGQYNCSNKPLNIPLNANRQRIFGNGYNTHLVGISITVQGNNCSVHNLLLEGAGDFGIKIGSDSRRKKIRGGIIYNLLIKNKKHNILAHGNIANIIFNNVFSEDAIFDGFLGNECNNLTFSNCYFQHNGRYGVFLRKGGEYKFNSCTISSNKNIGLMIMGTPKSKTLESYFSNCTITINQRNQRTRDKFRIRGTKCNKMGGTTLILGKNHTLTEGMQGCKIVGTKDCNGIYDIFNVTDISVDISKPFTNSQTGSFIRPPWDVKILAEKLGDVNDIFFTGGNLNYCYIEKGYNINFLNTRIKQQLYLKGKVGRILIIGNSRGRQKHSKKDIKISGRVNSGWAEIIYTDNYKTPNPKKCGLMLAVPNARSKITGNFVESRNNILVAENFIELNAGKSNVKINKSGINLSSVLSGVSPIIQTDEVYSFIPQFPQGVIVLTNGKGEQDLVGNFAFNTLGKRLSRLGYVGNAYDVKNNCVLTGNTGDKGKITLSSYNRKIYIENRTGKKQKMYWTVFR